MYQAAGGMTKKKAPGFTAARGGRGTDVSGLGWLRTCAGVALIGLLSSAAFGASAVNAPTSPGTTVGAAVGKSGLPLPRFVSLKSGRVNSRIGPGINYPIDWMYLKPGLPMEVIQEFDNWRRVRDSDGAEGWINQSLLSGRRTAIVAPWQRGKKTQISLLAEPDPGAAAQVFLEPGVIGVIQSCNGDWCEMSIAGHTGWMNQSLVWGAYPGELVED